jgi:hypothetical protein
LPSSSRSCAASSSSFDRWDRGKSQIPNPNYQIPTPKILDVRNWELGVVRSSPQTRLHPVRGKGTSHLSRSIRA